MKKKLAILSTSLLAIAVISSGVIIPFAANSTQSQNAKSDTLCSDGDTSSQSQTDNYNFTESLSSLSNNTGRITIKEVPVEKLTAETKQDYYHKILNSIDYFNTVSGTFKTNSLSHDGTETVVSYQVDMINNLSYEKVEGTNDKSETYVSPNRIVELNNLDKSIYTANQTHTKISELAMFNDVLQTKDDIKKAKTVLNSTFEDTKRITTDENGDKHYLNRVDPTNLCISSSYTLFPQGMVFGYLGDHDLWKITDETTYLGRAAVIIEGTAGEYGKKFNTSTFEMTVDKETGILLKHCGYDDDGNLSEYIETTKISFDQPNVKTYEPDNYSTYSQRATE